MPAGRPPLPAVTLAELDSCAARVEAPRTCWTAVEERGSNPQVAQTWAPAELRIGCRNRPAPTTPPPAFPLRQRQSGGEHAHQRRSARVRLRSITGTPSGRDRLRLWSGRSPSRARRSRPATLGLVNGAGVGSSRNVIATRVGCCVVGDLVLVDGDWLWAVAAAKCLGSAVDDLAEESYRVWTGCWPSPGRTR